MNFFNINNTFFEVLGYQMSYIEFFGTITGAIAVWLSAKANVWSWPIGAVSVILLMFLFYQVQLYPDMFLQVFFFVTNIIGWWRWTHPKPGEEDKKHELRVSFMQRKYFITIALIGMVGTMLFGLFAENLHDLFPTLFPLPSAYPYLDSFVTVMSVITTFLMIQKKIECWIIWIVVDIIATYLYFAKGVMFLGVEYLVFCFMAAFGLYHWIQEYTHYKHLSNKKK